MKAVAFQRQNELEVIDAPRPKPGPNEVVLKVHNCGICGSDLHAAQFGFGMSAGSIMGHEFCGEVEEVGTGVAGFKRGDRVTALPYVSCGTCERCQRGLEMLCRKLKALGLGQMPGAYAEYVTCGASSLRKLPDNVSSRDGALIEPLSVGLHAVNRAELEPGSTVIIMGAGPIGLATLIWAKSKGVKVVVSEIAAGRAELARQLGADVVINPNDRNPADKVREMIGRRPSVVFECIGVKGTLEQAIRMVDAGGRVIIVGVCMEPDQISPAYCIFREVSLRFVIGYTTAEFEATIDALAAGRIKPQPIVTDVISLDQVPGMFTTLRKPGAHAKVLIELPH